MRQLKIPRFVFSDPKLACPDLIPSIRALLDQSAFGADVFRELLAPGDDRVLYGYQLRSVGGSVQVSRGAVVLGDEILIEHNDFQPRLNPLVLANGHVSGTKLGQSIVLDRARSTLIYPSSLMPFPTKRLGARPMQLPDPGDVFYPWPLEPFDADLRLFQTLNPTLALHLYVNLSTETLIVPADKAFIDDDLFGGTQIRVSLKSSPDIIQHLPALQAVAVPIEDTWPPQPDNGVSIGMVYYGPQGLIGWAERRYPTSTIGPHRLHAFDHPNQSVKFIHMGPEWAGISVPPITLHAALSEWYDAAGAVTSLPDRLSGVITPEGDWKQTPNGEALPATADIEPTSDDVPIANWNHKDERAEIEVHKNSNGQSLATVCFKSGSSLNVVWFTDGAQSDSKTYAMSGQPGAYAYGRVSRGQVLYCNNRSLYVNNVEIIHAVPDEALSGTWEFFDITHTIQDGSPIIVATRAIGEGPNNTNRPDLTGTYLFWMTGSSWHSRKIEGFGGTWEVSCKATINDLYIVFRQSGSGQVVVKAPLNNLTNAPFTQVSRWDPASASESKGSFSIAPQGGEHVTMFHPWTDGSTLPNGQCWVNGRIQHRVPIQPTNSVMRAGPAQFPQCVLFQDTDHGAPAKTISGGIGGGGGGGGPGGPGPGDPPHPGGPPDTIVDPSLTNAFSPPQFQMGDQSRPIIDLIDDGDDDPPGPGQPPDPSKKWLFFCFGVDDESSQLGWVSGNAYSDSQTVFSYALLRFPGRFPAISIDDDFLYIATGSGLWRKPIINLPYPGTFLGGSGAAPPADIPPQPPPPEDERPGMIRPVPLPRFIGRKNLFNSVWDRVVKKILAKKHNAVEFPPPAIYTANGIELNPKAIIATKAFPNVRVGGPVLRQSGELFGKATIDAGGNEHWTILEKNRDISGGVKAGLEGFEEGQTHAFLAGIRWVFTTQQMSSATGAGAVPLVQMELVCEFSGIGKIIIQTRTRNNLTPTTQFVNSGENETPPVIVARPDNPDDLDPTAPPDIVVYSNIPMYAYCTAVGVKRG